MVSEPNSARPTPDWGIISKGSRELTSVIIKPYVLKNLLHKIRAMSLKRAELEQEQDAFGVRL